MCRGTWSGFFHMEAMGKRAGAGIHSIDLEINKGTILGLIGPNGAEKLPS